MKRILIAVDLQKDFVDGALGTKEAVQIIPEACRVINDGYDRIYVTLDTHHENYMQTLEGKYLPVEHCIRETQGWQLNKDVAAALEGKDYVVVEKPTFGSEELAQMIKEEEPDEITLIGLCTDICVISNALLLRAALKDTEIRVIASACAGVTPEKHDSALNVLASCQIQVI